MLTPQQIFFRARRAARFDRIVKRFDLVSFAALADWLAREPGKVERNEARRAQALDDLRDAVLRGDRRSVDDARPRSALARGASIADAAVVEAGR
jgi:hypothetical protein